MEENNNTEYLHTISDTQNQFIHSFWEPREVHRSCDYQFLAKEETETHSSKVTGSELALSVWAYLLTYTQ